MCIPGERPCGIARVRGGDDAPCVYGTVKFYETGNGVLVVADLCGLPDSETGIFGLHIHEGNSCGGSNFEQTGGHYNPGGQLHPSHPGDLPPLFSCCGKAFLAVLTDRFSMQQILGRTVVIHDHPDDLHTQPAGASGKKIACGVICPC